MDFNNEHQQEVEGMTCPVVPVTPKADAASVPGEAPRRRRRTERFAGLIDEMDAQAVEAQEVPAAPEMPVQQESPAVQEAPTIPAERPAQAAQPTMQMPSQGIPRPAALSGREPRRPAEGQERPVVRRPVDAEGYAPLQQLGSRVRRPEERPAPLDTPRRIRTPQTEHTAYADIPEEEERGSGKGLIAVIIALLVVAAIIVGLIMIPEEDPGILGTVKRAVTEPIKGLFAGDEDKNDAAPATADSFTATISKATAPYKVVFHMVTSANVTSVRVLDEAGNVIPTVTTLSAPNSESTIVWMFEMTREDSFDGIVSAQIQSGDSWQDTALTQRLTLGSAASPATDMPVAMQTSLAEISLNTPTEVPTSIPAMILTEETEAPAITPTPTEEWPQATPTPTMSVTATPTMRPAVTLAPEVTVLETPVPTEEPTPEPTPEPTEEPTPVPTPVVTPKLEAVAVDSADPKLISVTKIYKDDRKVDKYEREKPMNMPAGDDYLTRAFGVTTFRGNAFRQNAAVRTVANAQALSLEWTVEAGSVAGSSRNYYGIGWTGQPIITQWSAEVRTNMNVDEANKNQKNLREVIVAGMDGKIYFLDLLDGQPTREAIDFGYPMRATPSLHPLGYPMMTSGQYARKMKSGTSSKIGLYYYNLMDQKQLRLIDGIDRKLKRTYSENASGAFDTSALIDRNTNTLIAIGTNGLLYTEKLSMSMMLDAENNTINYEFEDPTETAVMMSHTKNQKAGNVAVESSLAMYANYVFYADMDGVLRCVDTTTMTTAWAVDTGDSVRAAIALDLEENGSTNTLWLYTANLVNSRTKGDVTIRRFNAMTGEEDWAYAINCAKAKKKDVTFNAVVIPGAMASPVIGQNQLGDLVYFTLSSVSATGAKQLEGDAAIPGVIIALNKETGEVAWHMAMEAYCYSSPVAVYDEAGKGWIIQACSNGTIYLLDGLTGDVVNTLAVNGVIEGSPAVYGDTMVIGTTGKDTSYIYGIKIN